jgi:hypothetical protein
MGFRPVATSAVVVRRGRYWTVIYLRFGCPPKTLDSRKPNAAP